MNRAQTTIDGILLVATGKRASGREFLVTPKSAILTPKASATLKEQWTSAGRDNAQVVMRLTEADGSNPHYVTGWDGKDYFVCMTETGLGYYNYHKLSRLTQDSEWDPKTRLIEVRQPLLRETMERSDVDMLLDRIKKTLTKSSKKRRKSRLRNMDKFFSEDSCDKGPGDSETEFEEIKEKDDRVPAKPEGSIGKNESTWDLLNSDGSVRRRILNHPMMRSEDGDPQLDKRELVDMNKESGGSAGSTPGGNKTDPQMPLRQLVRMNKDTGAFSEDGDAQLDKREHVRMDSEGSGGGTSATPGGNKTDPQLDKRPHGYPNSKGHGVRREFKSTDGVVRSEDTTCGCKNCGAKGVGYTTYAGEHGKCPECGARPEIVVRHEGLDLDDKTKDLFSKQKSPESAKKPLFMMMLMKKGKKSSMSEALVKAEALGRRHLRPSPSPATRPSDLAAIRNKVLARR